MDSRIPHGWRDVLDRPLHPSELARLLHQVSLSLVHLSDQGGQSIWGFSRGCSNKIGWRVTDWLRKYSPCRRRCRASSPHRDGLTVTSASAARPLSSQGADDPFGSGASDGTLVCR